MSMEEVWHPRPLLPKKGEHKWVHNISWRNIFCYQKWMDNASCNMKILTLTTNEDTILLAITNISCDHKSAHNIFLFEPRYKYVQIWNTYVHISCICKYKYKFKYKYNRCARASAQICARHLWGSPCLCCSSTSPSSGGLIMMIMLWMMIMMLIIREPKTPSARQRC